MPKTPKSPAINSGITSPWTPSTTANAVAALSSPATSNDPDSVSTRISSLNSLSLPDSNGGTFLDDISPSILSPDQVPPAQVTSGQARSTQSESAKLERVGFGSRLGDFFDEDGSESTISVDGSDSNGSAYDFDLLDFSGDESEEYLEHTESYDQSLDKENILNVESLGPNSVNRPVGSGEFNLPPKSLKRKDNGDKNDTRVSPKKSRTGRPVKAPIPFSPS